MDSWGKLNLLLDTPSALVSLCYLYKERKDLCLLGEESWLQTLFSFGTPWQLYQTEHSGDPQWLV